MTDQSPPDSEKALTPRLRTLLAPDHRVLSDQVAQDLSGRDVETLKHVVRQRSARPSNLSLPRAIGAIAVRDRSAETATILATFAGDEREVTVDRGVAAASLRLIATPEAREGLIRLLDAPEVLVRVEAIKSLGCIGDEATLRALQEVEPGSGGAQERQLAFAKALIAHRVGLEAEHLPFRTGVARRSGSEDQLIELSLRPLRPRTTAAELEHLRGSDYGIPLSARVGFGLRAGRARWTVFVNSDLTEAGAVFARSSKVFERPWITALLARIDQPTKSSAVQYIVLSDPEPNAARLMVVRTDGELAYSGQLTRPTGFLNFVVRDVARKGTAPTNVSGRMTSRGVEFDVRIPFGRRKNPSAGRVVAAR
jgi:hypothetical protein